MFLDIFKYFLLKILFISLDGQNFRAKKWEEAPKQKVPKVDMHAPSPKCHWEPPKAKRFVQRKSMKQSLIILKKEVNE